MPYISQDRRTDLDSGIRPASSGELNFVITQLLLQYLDRHGMTYQSINDVLGALEGAKLEFYRRIGGPYEDAAIARNGDVGYDGKVSREEPNATDPA